MKKITINTVDMPRSEPITGPIIQVLFKGAVELAVVRGIVELKVPLVSEFVVGAVGVGLNVDVEFKVGVDEMEVMEILECDDAFMADIDAVSKIRMMHLSRLL